MKLSKIEKKNRIHLRVRKKVKGTTERPRLTVFRSNKAIYCQVIDDTSGSTLVSASSHEEGVDTKVNKSEQAKLVGKKLAEKAMANNISTVVFDRSGYLYHGRVKALADGAREGGLKF